MSKPTTLLIIDDDQEILNLLSTYLEKQGFCILTQTDASQLSVLLKEETVDLVILDLMLPFQDGLEVCRELRTYSNVPVIMLTAKGDETDKIVGLELGADDYLAKPFNPRELLARIKVVLRRAPSRSMTVQAEISASVDAVVKWFEFGQWRLNTAAMHLVANDGLVIPLSGAEYRLLSVLLKHAHSVLSRDFLLNHLKGRDAHPFDRSMDVQVSRLRQRLDDTDPANPLIKTIRGEGYMLMSTVKKVLR